MVFRFSYGFPMGFLWFSGFPMVFLWFSYGFPMIFLWFSYGFPMVFPALRFGSGQNQPQSPPWSPVPAERWPRGASLLRCAATDLGPKIPGLYQVPIFSVSILPTLIYLQGGAP